MAKKLDTLTYYVQAEGGAWIGGKHHAQNQPVQLTEDQARYDVMSGALSLDQVVPKAPETENEKVAVSGDHSESTSGEEPAEGFDTNNRKKSK